MGQFSKVLLAIDNAHTVLHIYTLICQLMLLPISGWQGL